MKQLLLPKFDYYLDNSDPDIEILSKPPSLGKSRTWLKS
jgi:hypothetical protein